MKINSIEYLFFLLIILVMYYVCPKRGKRILLVVASIGFYAVWSVPHTILLLTSSIGTFFIGIIIDKETSKKQQNEPSTSPANIKKSKSRLFLVLGLVLLIGELFVYKYSGFIQQQINAVLSAVKIGFQFQVVSNSIIIPVGISFFVFQSIGYLVDVYRGKTQADNNIIDFLLFISFFPKIIQGPIERSDGFLRQIKEIETRGTFNYQRICNASVMIIWGLFMKMVIADRASIIVNRVFSTYYIYGTTELAFGAICYAIQIYCDFAGYSVMAAGAASLFGFELIQNFDCPYFSASIKEFWRRWHISLSSWFRDYVYFPLGGSRCKKRKKYRNLIVVMLISGVWHGVGWNFIVWGLIYGLYQVFGDMISPLKKKMNKRLGVHTESASYKIGSIIVTFVLVDIAWVFFRAPNIGIALDYLRIMFTRVNPWVLFDDSLLKLGLNQIELNVMAISMIILFIVDYIQYRRKKRLDQMLQNQCLWFKWGVIILLFTLIWVCGEYGPAFSSSDFIYQSF